MPKSIDDGLKANLTFKPFNICSFYNYYNGYEVKEVVGIRKDGRLYCADKSQISIYNEKNYKIIENKNFHLVEEIAKLEQKRDLENSLVQIKYNKKRDALLQEFSESVEDWRNKNKETLDILSNT